MPQRWRAIIILIFVLTIAAALAVPFFQSLQVNSLRAEARVMLSYLATLQQAYHTDTGKYVFFEEQYGGPIQGKENCLRPLGAEELGFQLKACGKHPEDGGLRYVYQALKVEIPGQANPIFLGRATSGSDINGVSLICIGSKAKDVWEISPTGEARQVVDCDER